MTDTQRPERRHRGRWPRPVLPERLPSGRGATEQPNAGGDGDLRLTTLMWALVAVAGAAAGGFGAAMLGVLRLVELVAFGSSGGALDRRIYAAGGDRRLVVLVVAGVVTAVGWLLLRKVLAGRRSDLDDALWSGHGELSWRRSIASGVLSEIAVGAGASLGREAAPKLAGGATASLLARWARLTPAQRRLLVACGGGAGMAAIYNVPLGGALLTAEVLYGSMALPVVLPALLCSVVATAVSWLFLPGHATYPGIPAYAVHGTQLGWAVVAGPLLGLVSVGWVRLVGMVSARRPTGWRLVPAITAAFPVTGLVALWHPQLLGNGKDLAAAGFAGAGSLGLLLALGVVKPLVTALCLGSGATGGLFTPTLATGAMLGGAFGSIWLHAWPGAPLGSFALIGAAAFLGSSMQAPLAGLVLVLELTRSSVPLMVPMALATALATIVARYLDGYSIYSARLPAL